MNLYVFNEKRRGAIYGVGTYIRELTTALKKRDIFPCVVNLFSDKPYIHIEEMDGIMYWHIPAPMSEPQTMSELEQRALYYHNVVYLLQLRIKDMKELIFHLNFPQCGNLAEELKQVFDCRIVSVAHFSEWGFTVFDNLPRLRFNLNEKNPDTFGEKLKKSIEEEKKYYNEADHCICLSNYMHEILCMDYGLDFTKITIIANGLEDNRQQCDKYSLRKKWNISPKEKIILFAGRMDEIKGISYLIGAFRHVVSIFPQCRLVFAGSGDFNKYIGEAQEICTNIIYTGLLDKIQLKEWYGLADVGVIPSLYEPFGFVAVEMMMHQLPMVVTATSGMNEVVDESCGLKVPIVQHPDKVEIDAGILAEKILYLLHNPKEAGKLAINGRKRYNTMYTSEIFGQEMVRFYKALIAQ